MSLIALFPVVARLLRMHRAACVAAAMLCMPFAANALCVGSCSCNTTITNVVFAPYNPLSGSNDDSTGQISVNCTGLVALAIGYTVTVGTGSSNSFSARQMVAGTNKLVYNLYTSVAYAQVLGDGTSGTGTLSGTITLSVLGVGTAQAFPIYGRIPSGQTSVVPGTFADTLVVTLTYL